MINRLTLLIACLLGFAWPTEAADHKYTLVFDAGHGGKDGGACANGAKEKNINLNVALLSESMLSAIVPMSRLSIPVRPTFSFPCTNVPR